MESSKYREYERLKGEGNDEAMKDPDDNIQKNIKAPGLGYMPGKFTPGDYKYRTIDYIIPPKVLGQHFFPSPLDQEPPEQLEEDEQHAFDMHPELADS